MSEDRFKTDMGDEWHCIINGRQGPYQLDAIKAEISRGTLTRSTMVLKKDLDNWIAADRTQLAPLFEVSDCFISIFIPPLLLYVVALWISMASYKCTILPLPMHNGSSTSRTTPLGPPVSINGSLSIYFTYMLLSRYIISNIISF